jgi:hypothetical protein
MLFFAIGGASRDCCDLGDKAISALGQSFNKTRLIRAIPEGLAQPIDSLIQATIKVDEGVVRP